MSAGVSERTVAGHRAVVLDNGRLRVTVIPALGARVWELVDVERDVQWVWHRPGVPLEVHGTGADYDAVWAGGWEELFPNDAQGAFEGRELPDHGEWWSRAWEVEAMGGGEEPFVRLACRMTVRRARCVKEFRLTAGRAEVTARYRIEGDEPAPFHFLFKQHLPVELRPGCRLALPGGTVTAVDPAFGTLMPAPGPHQWPVARGGNGESVDLRETLPASSRRQEFIYVTGLPEAWCGMDDPARGASLRMHWDAAAMPYLWLFISYGGWRDVHTVVLEPCTNLPKDLAAAVAAGRAARMAAGGVFETSVRVTLAAMARA
jgi:hypothetical protein